MHRKARIREYKETPRAAGVYVVRNTASGKLLIGASPDLAGMLNRQRFQLENGAHPDRALQQDWNELGPHVFAFEVLDELRPSSEPGYDPTGDLRVLKHLWLERLMASQAELYPFSKRGT